MVIDIKINFISSVDLYTFLYVTRLTRKVEIYTKKLETNHKIPVAITEACHKIDILLLHICEKLLESTSNCNFQTITIHRMSWVFFFEAMSNDFIVLRRTSFSCKLLHVPHSATSWIRNKNLRSKRVILKLWKNIEVPRWVCWERNILVRCEQRIYLSM